MADTLADKLKTLYNTKQAFRTLITDNGGSIPSGTTFDKYPSIVQGLMGGSSEEGKVVFIDYEGTEVASYSNSDFASVEALPDAPDHSADEVPLTFDSWNWSLEDAKAYVENYPEAVLTIGANYHTTDGLTHVIWHVEDENNGDVVITSVADSSGLSIDWGDGTTNSNLTHTYTAAGDFHCKITGGGSYIVFGASNRSYKFKTAKVFYSSTITSIGSSAFSGCSSLQSIVIPDGVTSIGSSAFSSCYSLQSIVIPDGVTSIGSSAFSGCSSLQSIVIPGSVTRIGTYAFSGCSSLQSIVISDGVTSIGSAEFNYCYSLGSITIPGSVTSIGSSAFSSCYSLQSIVIPDGVTSIGDYAFQYCYSLQSIVIPGSVTSIGSSAFSGCRSLQSIVISDGVTSIGSSAFNSCNLLYVVTLLATTPPTLASTNAFSTSYQKKFIVPKGCLEAYQSATNWSTYADYMVEADE